MEPGDQKDLNLTFPEEYAQPELAGKGAIFTITLHELKERELPELDDDFAQEVSDFDTLAELQEHLEKRYRDEAEAKTKANKQAAIFAALLEQIEADVPQTLVDEETRLMLTQMVTRLSQQGMDVNKVLTPEIVQQYREQIRPEAVVQIKQALALQTIARQESITVDDEAVNARVQDVLRQTQDPQKFDMARLRDVIRDEILRDKVMEWLEAENRLELVPEGTLSAPDAGKTEPEEVGQDSPQPSTNPKASTKEPQPTAAAVTVDAQAVTVDTEAAETEMTETEETDGDAEEADTSSET
jgi:trigger factor